MNHAVQIGIGLESVAKISAHASVEPTLETHTHPTQEGERAPSDAVADSLLGS